MAKASSKISGKPAQSVPTCPHGFFQFEGLAPDGLGNDFYVVAKDALLGHFRTTHNRSKQLEGFSIPAALMSPTGIWKDLKSPEKHDWTCHCGRPEERSAESIWSPPRPGFVFSVYVRSRRATGGQLVIDSWEWIPEDPGQPGAPADHTKRYGIRLWPLT